MKKIFTLLVCGCLVFSLSACGNNVKSKKPSDKNDDTSENSEIQAQTELNYPEKVTEIYTVEYENRYVMTENIKDTFLDKQNGNELPYRLYIPKDYTPSKKYPVILFLHGAGETGTDNLRQINNIGNMFEYNGDIVSGAFILCPQSAGWWNLDRDTENDNNGSLGSAVHLLQDIMKKYSCDPDRVYVTGLSMGGYATWDLLERFGDMFAAGVPICGGGNHYNGKAYVDIPIKIYHGTADKTVSFDNSERMYNAIVAAGGQKVEFIRLEGYDHNTWNYAYADREMFCWMFSQSKAGNPNGEYQYERVDRFSIKDSKGNTVINDADVIKTSYRRESNKSDKMIIELTLTAKGLSDLDKAYTSSDGSPFTFYYGKQKVYSFTATTSHNGNVFCIADVFNIDNYLKFYNAIEKKGN